MADKTQAAPAADPKTAMTTATGAKYPVLAVKEQYSLLSNGTEAIEIFKENMAGQALGTFDLTIIKVPSQGATSWEFPTINGAESRKFIEGIVIGIRRRRAYWVDPTPGGTPPDCGSIDMETGVGNPGGECGKCPLAQFGSAKGADDKPRKGQACRENKLIAMLVPGEPMPVILKVPPSSLKPVLQFQTKLPVRFSGAVCRFGLVKDTADGKIAYSKIVPEFVGALPPDQAKLVQDYARIISGHLEKAADKASSTADVGEEA